MRAPVRFHVKARFAGYDGYGPSRITKYVYDVYVAKGAGIAVAVSFGHKFHEAQTAINTGVWNIYLRMYH